MGMEDKMTVITEEVINNHIIEKVDTFNYLGYTITVTNNRDLEITESGSELLYDWRFAADQFILATSP
jgi:hypothetical protein